MRAAIYMQYFTCGERGVCQEQNCIYDFFDFTHPADRVTLIRRDTITLSAACLNEANEGCLRQQVDDIMW